MTNLYDELKLSGADALDLFNRRCELRKEIKQSPVKKKLGAVWLPIAVHDKLRIHCARSGIPMSGFVQKLLKKAGVR